MIPFSELEKILLPTNSPNFVSKSVGIPEGTLAYWRSAGIGPKFTKVGKTIIYAKEDILNYLKNHRYQSTEEMKKASAATEANDIR